MDREQVEDWKRNRREQISPDTATAVQLKRGDTVCLTGSGLGRSRAGLKGLAERAGIHVASSVTAHVVALVVPPGGSSGSKATAAASLGLPVIGYEDFAAALSTGE